MFAKKPLGFLIFFLFTFTISHAAGYYDFNERCVKAYRSYMSFRIVEGNQILAEELKIHPDNLIPVMLASYDDVLTLVFRGDPAELKRRANNLSVRMAKLEQGDKSSPWHRYAKATLNFHWAAINFRFNETMSGANLFRKTYNLLRDNQAQFLNFKHNDILLGVAEGMIGSVPDNYRWIANILGFKGSVKSGNTRIINFLNSNDPATNLLREETVVYYCYFKSILFSEPQHAFEYLDGNRVDVVNNHLFAFTKANIALNNQKAALARRTLENINQSSAYMDVPAFDYELGLAALGNLDSDCITYFTRFLNRTKNSYFIKETYQKMSQYYYAIGNNAKGLLYKNKILNVGSAITDADKQAVRYAKSTEQVNPTLLKVHLLCDGGNYSKAKEIVSKYSKTDFPDIASQLEFSYRCAQIYNALGQKNTAIGYYKEVIAMGKDRKEHYAARSALELANLYEDSNQRALALSYYQQCINMKNHDYENSLEQKAKAALNRLR